MPAPIWRPAFVNAPFAEVGYPTLREVLLAKTPQLFRPCPHGRVVAVPLVCRLYGGSWSFDPLGNYRLPVQKQTRRFSTSLIALPQTGHPARCLVDTRASMATFILPFTVTALVRGVLDVDIALVLLGQKRCPTRRGSGCEIGTSRRGCPPAGNNALSTRPAPGERSAGGSGI